MTRHLATFTAGAAAGALLALLLTQPAISRQSSAPRPSAVTRAVAGPVAPRTPGAPTLVPSVAQSPDPARGVEAEPGRLALPTREAHGGESTPPGATGSASTSPQHTPKPTTRPTARVSGLATWFAAPAGTAAAGPALRAALGKGWRGQTVRVNGIRVRLTDWMRADKLIDLNPGAFRAVCGSLSVGVCKVRVSW